MVRVRDIPRTATFAWSTSPQAPSIVTGTRAGALDVDFTSESTLELWDLGLDQISTQASEQTPAASVVTEAKFHDIAWSRPTEDLKLGVIAGALDNGALQLWDASKLRTKPQDSTIAKLSSHSAAIKAVRFNRSDDRLVATAGVQGELYITDLNKTGQPTRLGVNMARADDLECLDWNYKPPNIFATGSTGGAIVVWDMKAKDKKDMLTISNVGRRPVSAVCWDPTVSTRLVSATSSDQEPAIHVWDLRKAAEPEKTLKRHELGVLSLAWCTQDSSLLFSCGKDNRTICWNPNTGLPYGEYSVASNWAFTTRWSPTNPDLFATAAFDGNISVQSLQNANQASKVEDTPADGEDFFSQTRQVQQGPSFSLLDAPAWKKTRCGASFGFGGKLVHFRLDKATSKSKVTIEAFHLDGGIVTKAQDFEQAIEAGKVSDICEEKLKSSKSEDDKTDWKVIQNLAPSQLRKTIRDYLGYATEEVNDTLAEKIKPAADSTSADDDEESFAAMLAASAASKQTTSREPFKLYGPKESAEDAAITAALVQGNFMKALDLCVEANRMSDAFMIASCGGQECTDKIQRVYLEKNMQGNSYLRLLSAISKKDLCDVVENADVANWKEIMITLCSFAKDDEFADLCGTLGDRLQAAGADRKDSSFCFMVGSKLPKVLKTWIDVLHESEARDLDRGDADTSYAVHARALQDFIEKVTVYRKVSGFQDSKSEIDGTWPLAALYDKYTEFADVLASHGQMDLAAKYYDLLPASYSTAAIVQQRVKKATQKSAKPTRPVVSNVGTSNIFTPAQATMPVAATPASNFTAGRAYTPSGYQPNTSAYNPPSQTPMYGAQMAQTPAYGAPAPPVNASMPPPPRPGEGQPRPGDTVNWNDTPDNFFNKAAIPRRNTPGPVQQMTQNVYSAPTPKPVTLPPPPKVGQSSKPSTPISAMGIERPPSASSTSAYTPVMSQQNPTSNGYSSYPQQQTQPPARNPYAPPPQNTASTSYAPASMPQPASNTYAPAPNQQQNNRPPPMGNVPAPTPPPPTGRYGPPAGYQPQGPTTAPLNQAYPPRASPGPGQFMGTNGLQGMQNRGSPAPFSNQAAPPPPAAAPLAPPPKGPPRAAKPAESQHPPPSQMSPDAQLIKDVLSREMGKVSANAPPKFQEKVDDMRKRLDILYRHLDQNDLLRPDTVAQMSQVCQRIQAQDWATAQSSFEVLMKEKQEAEGSQWMVGVKKLIKLNAPPA